MRSRVWGRVAIIAIAALVSSCGGGGGGSDGGGSSLSVSSDKSSVHLVGFVNAAIPQESIHFTLRGGSGTYYGGVKADKSGIISASFVGTSETTGTVNLSPTGVSGLATSGTVTFMLCRDAACTQVAWSQSIPYTLNVFELSTPGLTITGYEGANAAPTKITITPPDTTHLLKVDVATGTTPAWLSATRSSDSEITVNASAVGLMKGSHASTAYVSFADTATYGTTRQTVPVSFTVGDGTVVPPAKSLDLMRATTGASLAGSAAIAFQGTQAPAWTASSDQPWLKLTSPGGTGAGTLPYTIDTTQLDAIANWETGVANVTINAAGLSNASFQISLNKKLPEVLSASPNPLVAGRTNTLRVAGKGFSQLTNANLIKVGSLSGITGSIVSDTEALLTVPSTVAGSTTVSIANTAGLTTAQAALSVVTPTALPAALVANTGDKRSAVFDPVRNALYVTNTAQNTLFRFRLVTGQWQTASLAVPAIGDLAFAPDRKTLYVSSNGVNLLAIDPDTLQVQATHTYPNPESYMSPPLAGSWGVTKGMAVTNDLRLWFGSSQWSPMYYFDMRRAEFGTYPAPDLPISGRLSSPQFYASGDGSKMMVIQYSISPPAPSLVYTTSANSVRLAPTLPEVRGYAILSEDGSKALLGPTDLYSTADDKLIGHAELPSGIALDAALSPNGSRLYVVRGTANYPSQVESIEVFDTTKFAAGSTTNFASLGQIALPNRAIDCGSNPPDYGCTVGAFLISPLGNTLFWLGNKGVVVIPIAAGMAQAAAGNTSLLSAR